MLKINWLANRKKLKRNALMLPTQWPYSTGKNKLENSNASVKLNRSAKRDKCSETTGLQRNRLKNA
jgi:hypothetical protein